MAAVSRGRSCGVYPHGDLNRLEHILDSSTSGRRLIVTDSVFSMDGDHAPLVTLCDVAERAGAMLLVDEAHGTGVFGARGRGVCELAGVEHRVAVRVGTLSKAAGVLGGFVVGSRLLIDWLWNNARSQMFSTALPPMVCAAACAALDIIEQEPERRTRLLRLGDVFRTHLSRAGIPSEQSDCGPIVPLVVGRAPEALQMSEELRHRGYLVPAIRPPTVPRGTSRLRVSLSASHTENDIRQLAQALDDVWQAR